MIYSPESARAYRADWCDFCRWLDDTFGEAYPLEAVPDDVLAYLIARRGKVAANTLERRLCAINHFFGIAGLKSPAESSRVRTLMRLIKAEDGTAKTPKHALCYADACIIASCLPDTLVGVRDKAIVLVGWGGAFRRSELAAMRCEHLEFTREGLIVTLPRSKGDRFGAAVRVHIPRMDDGRPDPVAALADWLCSARVKKDAVFRDILKDGRVAMRSLHPRTISDIIKRAARRAGYREDVASHSLRRGYATDIGRKYDLATLMTATRHKSSSVAVAYIDPARRDTLSP